jgi:hypothetical protein
MTSRSPTSIDNMLSRIPAPVRAALEAEFCLQVRAAYAKHLSNKLAAFDATAPQAALPSLPTIVPGITPLKEAEPVTETSGNIQCKRKASGSPSRSQRNSMNPIASFAAATIAVAASAAAAITAATTTVTTATATTTAATTTAAAGTSSENALTVPDSDSDATNDTFLPRTFPKKEHGLTIILGMNINTHLKLIKLDISIVAVKAEPSTFNTNYVNGIHFFVTVLAITEAPVAVKDLLPQLTNIGNRKDVIAKDIIDFLTTNGVKLTPLTINYKTIMTTDHTSPIIIEYSVTRHVFESKELPTFWLQFCILFKKEKLLVPFNEKGEAINLGNQFIDQKWTWDFTHYCNNNLNYRIAPVDRADKKGSQGPEIIIRGLQYNSAWDIIMPTPDPKP